MVRSLARPRRKRLGKGIRGCFVWAAAGRCQPAFLVLLSFAVDGCGLGPAGGPGGDGPGGQVWGDPVKVSLLEPFQGKWVCDAPMHPDITVDGHVVTCSGMPTSEYRLFAIHQHGPKTCAKAWHHEDRFDPGDMSKCYVRLALVGEELHFQMRMQEGLGDVSDPDLTGSPPIVADSASDCDADAPAGRDWLEWNTYVFVRPSPAQAPDK